VSVAAEVDNVNSKSQGQLVGGLLNEIAVVEGSGVVPGCK
jgi:hypothetical protein